MDYIQKSKLINRLIAIEDGKELRSAMDSDQDFNIRLSQTMGNLGISKNKLDKLAIDIYNLYRTAYLRGVRDGQKTV